jgi:phosphoribosyl 1,2-cyclic phosphodiesterase/CheY-like chemotaxis protein
MRVKFWGTRGSIAKAGADTLRYGGSTSCIQVITNNGSMIVFDCGTGAHNLGQSLMKNPGVPMRGHLFISHTHWDHIQGIPFFAPLYQQGNRWDIYAPRSLLTSIQETLAGQMQHTYFPIDLEKLGASIHYHDLVEGELTVENIHIRTHYLNHTALTLGYRLECDGVVLVYACDHEPYSHELAVKDGEMNNEELLHAAFLKKADLVIHDAQYTNEQFPEKIGWGHSTFTYAMRMCEYAGVKRLALTHHDPLHNDEAIDHIVQRAKQILQEKKSSLDVFAACEGMEIDLLAAPHPSSPNAKTAGENAKTDPAIYVNRILLVGQQQSALTQQIIEATRMENLAMVQVENAADAILALSHDAFSVVMLDASCTDIFSAAHQLRHAMQDNINLPLIAIADKEEIRRGKEAGITDWLVQPFTTQYVRTRIRAWIIRQACKWCPAPLPANENERLDALLKSGLLDTEREERFDRITRIAASAFNVPMASISLIDQKRQWFKSSVGVDAQETPRDLAFCAHTILSSDILQIPDTFLDTRFRDHPMVQSEPRIRFYAGCPIQDKDGHKLGTLCIVDTRPRELNKNDLNILKDLALLVENEIKK